MHHYSTLFDWDGVSRSQETNDSDGNIESLEHWGRSNLKIQLLDRQRVVNKLGRILGLLETFMLYMVDLFRQRRS